MDTVLAQIICDLISFPEDPNYYGLNLKITNYLAHMSRYILLYFLEYYSHPRIVATPAHALSEKVAALGLE